MSKNPFTIDKFVFLLLRFKSDRFKTLRDMKLLKKKVQGDADEQ